MRRRILFGVVLLSSDFGVKVPEGCICSKCFTNCFLGSTKRIISLFALDDASWLIRTLRCLKWLKSSDELHVLLHNLTKTSGYLVFTFVRTYRESLCDLDNQITPRNNACLLMLCWRLQQ